MIFVLLHILYRGKFFHPLFWAEFCKFLLTKGELSSIIDVVKNRRELYCNGIRKSRIDYLRTI